MKRGIGSGRLEGGAGCVVVWECEATVVGGGEWVGWGRKELFEEMGLFGRFVAWCERTKRDARATRAQSTERGGGN